MKRAFSVLLTLLLCLSLFACGKEDTQWTDQSGVDTCPPAPEGETPPAQDTVTPPVEEPVPADPLPGEKVAPEVTLSDSTTLYTDSDNATVVQVDITVPVCGSLPQIHDYYQSMISDLLGVYSLNREDAARQKGEYQAAGQEFTPWTVNMTTEVTRNDGVTLSLMRTVTEEWPGHESVQYYAETFDVATQGRLLLGDLFQPGADYLTRLADSSEVDQLNFALSDDSLMLCIEGGYRALPLSDLSDILQPQYVTE